MPLYNPPATIISNDLPIALTSGLYEIITTELGVTDLISENSINVSKIAVRDTFTRANSTASPGSAETGQVWQVGSGTWGIDTNMAYLSSLVNINYDRMLVDSGIANAIITVKIAVHVITNISRVWIRAVDASNFLVVNAASDYKLYRVLNNVTTQIGSYAGTPASGNVVKITAKGSAVKVYVNGIERISVIETANQNATMHGLSANNIATRFDNFKVEVF